MSTHVKTGSDHLAALRDHRSVWLDGAEIADVTSHPAFRNACATAAALYDAQAAPDSIARLTFALPDGARVNRAWEMPEDYAQLLDRRRALEEWAELHCGFFGRSPDHVASCLTGMLMGIEVFESYDPARARALADYVRFARARDLFLTYAIINPQADRSKPAHAQSNSDLTLAIVDRDAAGVTVRGAKMLSTSAVMANEVFVACIQPMVPGDERHAIAFAVPMNISGLRILSRKSYEAHAVSQFDNPLAWRFDENDAVLLFDDVKIPWERIFAIDDIFMMARMFHATPAHVFQNYQCQIRLLVKLRFLAGIAHRIAETNGIIAMPQVRETLGQLAAEVGMVEGLLCGMEAKGRMAGEYFIPDRHMLYAAQVLTQQLYPKFIDTLRELAGGAVIMLPASIADLHAPQTAADLARTQHSPAATPFERIKFFKLAWDAIGSEFASRHVQYEKFYAGANFVTRGHSFRTFDWDASARLVSRVLAATPGP